MDIRKKFFIKKKFFTVWVVGPWNKLSREIVDLEFRWWNLVQDNMSLPMAGGWNWIIF